MKALYFYQCFIELSRKKKVIHMHTCTNYVAQVVYIYIYTYCWEVVPNQPLKFNLYINIIIVYIYDIYLS